MGVNLVKGHQAKPGSHLAALRGQTVLTASFEPPSLLLTYLFLWLYHRTLVSDRKYTAFPMTHESSTPDMEKLI